MRARSSAVRHPCRYPCFTASKQDFPVSRDLALILAGDLRTLRDQSQRPRIRLWYAQLPAAWAARPLELRYETLVAAFANRGAGPARRVLPSTLG